MFQVRDYAYCCADDVRGLFRGGNSRYRNGGDHLRGGRAQFIIAGASAVQIGTANFTDTLAMPRIIDGLNAWLDGHGIADINELRGALKLN